MLQNLERILEVDGVFLFKIKRAISNVFFKNKNKKIDLKTERAKMGKTITSSLY